MTLLAAGMLLLMIIALAIWGDKCGDLTSEIAFPLTILVIVGVVLWSG